MKATIQSGASQSQVWDASTLSAGIYYYQTKTTVGKSFTGKLVKL
jgi:hypothetical protein